MNIKSLLLGSAAALVAVSGARAADAVMAEPEAVEYVRVCDAYGAGYFYIPGTETCLKIGGRVRYIIEFNNGDKGWRKTVNAMLNVTAKADTELGTLTSYIEIGASNKSGISNGLVFTDQNTNGVVDPGELALDNVLTVDAAYILLGGLKMGWHDTLYDGGLDGEGFNGGGAGIHQIGYTFSGSSGFSAAVSLEEETNNFNYVPNIVGKVSFTQGWGGVDAWVAYDDVDVAGALAGSGNNANWSTKARLTANVGSAGVLKVLASYNSDKGFYANGGTWTLGATYKHTISPKLALTGGVQYQADTNYKLAGTPSNLIFGGVVDYTIVPNFSAKLAVWHNTHGAAANTTVGFLRFERSF